MRLEHAFPYASRLTPLAPPMFDFSFFELLVVGVVALIVIGPERLPKVARTAGHLYGRLQRYVSTVKSDISREVELDELKRAGQQFKESVNAVQTSVQQQTTLVDDFLREETSAAGGLTDASTPAQPAAPQAVIETARRTPAGESAAGTAAVPHA